MDITQSEGYQKLAAAVERDETEGSGFHDYRAKLHWAVERAEDYAEQTGLPADEILNAWERGRRYWYMNYYQDCNQPKLDGACSRIFDTEAELLAAIADAGFRCPRCGGVSQSPYECNSGLEMEPGKTCDWKVYGLLRDLGKGIYVFVKTAIHGNTIFMPVAWENQD